MSRPRNPIPTYRRHKATGQARVRINGKDVYLGPYGSPESRERYARAVAELGASPTGKLPTTTKPTATGSTADLTLIELMAMYVEKHVSRYYMKAGKATSEQHCIASALRPLKQLYGSTPAADFGPLRLKAVREHLIRAGRCRTQVNKCLGRIRFFFKWCTEQELIPPSVLQGLQSVAGLKKGRSEAVERDPVHPVADWLVDAVLPYVSRQVAAMLQVQRFTGCRPGEVCQMTAGSIDRSGRVWLFTPATHKTEHHGQERVIPLGPRTQKIVGPFMRLDLSAPIFSPIEAEAERLARRRENRRTPLSCGNRAGTNRKRSPRRKPGQWYTANSYAHAVKAGCLSAFPLPKELAPYVRKWNETLEQWHVRTTAEQRDQIRAWRADHHFHPNQVRHSRATELRRQYGLEVTRTVLGHSDMQTTLVYAEADLQTAVKVAGECG